MNVKMLCTDCFRTAEADTVLEGSDVAEMLGWCFFALPGLIYCWWRHALRIKVCSHCGGGHLVRQARAAQLREPIQAPPSAGPRVRNLTGPVRWPRALATPRERLRHGSVAALLETLLLISLAAVVLGFATGAPVTAAIAIFGIANAAWILYEGVRISQKRASLPGCRAWDQNGRPLGIERII